MNDDYEVVHTVTDYWGGPRRGIANYKGVPHFYESLFDEKADDWSDTFLLTPMDEETFELVLEGWEIWTRWEQAYQRGETTIDTHPALPLDKVRHEQIAQVLARSLKFDSENAIAVKANFKGEKSREPIAVRWFAAK